jgi:predicted ferric reductase
MARQRYWELNRITWFASFKKNLLHAPLWRKHYSRDVQILTIGIGSMPGRHNCVLLLSWTAINLWWMIYPISESSSAVLALRQRAGTAALFNIFPILLFSLKNNPLIFLLNIPFDTFNVFHRWLARLFILETLLHICAWLQETLETLGWNGVQLSLSRGIYGVSLSCGAMSTFAVIVIMFQAWNPLRHTFYEIFLSVHKLLAFITFLGIYLHLFVIHLTQSSWIYVVASIWICDVIARFVRLVLRNVDRRKWTTDVTIRALEGGACRLTFHLRTCCSIRPETYIYVWLPRIATFQSHPFSIAWSEPKESGTDISVVIRAQTGFTKALYDTVRASPKDIIIDQGVCEGFYGNYHDLSSYGQVILLAGGVGIAHQIMYLKELLEGYRNCTVAARCIHLVWWFPTSNYFNWVRPWMDKIFAFGCCEHVVRLNLYLTRQTDLQGIDGLPEWVAIKYGRCNVEKLIQDSATSGNGVMAVVICGPASFSDSVRIAVRNRMKDRVMDIFDASFRY